MHTCIQTCKSYNKNIPPMASFHVENDSTYIDIDMYVCMFAYTSYVPGCSQELYLFVCVCACVYVCACMAPVGLNPAELAAVAGSKSL